VSEPRDSPPRLTEPQRRKLLLWKRLVVGSMAGAGLFALAEIGVLVWPGAPRAVRVVVSAVLIEMAASTVLLGAAGKCPACGARFGMQYQGLVPRRCGRCGVELA